MRYPSALFLLSILLPSPFAVVAQSPGDATSIILPLRFHIVEGLEMRKRGTSMDSWVPARDVRESLLPEADRIWRQAGIQWSIVSIDVITAPAGARRDRTTDYLRETRRNAAGRSDPRRIRMLDDLLDTAASDGAAIDVYLVPYLGERSQGNAGRKKKRLFLAQWTDKPSRGARPPEKFRLVEPEPFEHGSLGRTLAHELGHVLGLRHPDKTQQRVFGRLMGGKRAGYALTAEEIALARQTACRDFPCDRRR